MCHQLLGLKDGNGRGVEVSRTPRDNSVSANGHRRGMENGILEVRKTAVQSRSQNTWSHRCDPKQGEQFLDLTNGLRLPHRFAGKVMDRRNRGRTNKTFDRSRLGRSKDLQSVDVKWSSRQQGVQNNGCIDHDDHACFSSRNRL